MPLKQERSGFIHYMPSKKASQSKRPAKAPEGESKLKKLVLRAKSFYKRANEALNRDKLEGTPAKKAPAKKAPAKKKPGSGSGGLLRRPLTLDASEDEGPLTLSRTRTLELDLEGEGSQSPSRSPSPEAALEDEVAWSPRREVEEAEEGNY